MDLALLFVLPLVGGFAFVTRFALLRYATGREESQRLYYRAAFYGLIFAIGAGAAHSVARNHVVAYARFVDALASDAVLPLLEKDKTQSTVAPTREAVRVRIDVALICFYGFAIGALTPLWNLLLRLADAIWVRLPASEEVKRRSFLATLNLRAIKDHLERLLAESLISASPIQVTLSNAKVYVGMMLESIDPASPTKNFKIQPWMSGFRSSVNGRVDFNTFYDNVLAGLDEEEAKRRAATFQLVIPVDKVVSAGGFDFDTYEQFVLEQGMTERDRVARSEAPPTASSPDLIVSAEPAPLDMPTGHSAGAG